MAHRNKSNWSPHKPVASSIRAKHKKTNENYDEKEASERIGDILHRHGIENLTPEKMNLLTQFYFLIIKGQNSINFTRLVSLREIALKHFADCLLVPQLTKLQYPLMDLGSGGGFPGIPLAINSPSEEILLAEGVAKRVEFMKNARDKLGLTKVKVLGKYIEPDFMYPLKMVITRAVEESANTISRVDQTLSVGGRVVLMKGPQYKPELARVKNEYPHYKLVEEHVYSIPNSPHGRSLLCFEKVSPK